MNVTCTIGLRGTVSSAFICALSALVVPSGYAEEKTARDTSGVLEEIVVTATRREELAQRVPVAVSAFSGDLIRDTRVTNLDDLAQLVPGPSFIPISGASQAIVQIRGTIGGTDDSPAFDTPTALFVDDLYYGSVSNFYPDFFDAAQVAVLRGPQGTAFGRNVVGGAIQVTSNRPQFETSGRVSGTYLNRPGWETDGYYNAPINDQFATRLAFDMKDVDGYSDNVVTGNQLDDKDVWAVRWSNRYRPSEVLDVNLIASYSNENSKGPGFRYFGEGFRVEEVESLPGSRDVLQDTDGSVDKDAWSAVLHADWETAIGTVSSITGYTELDQKYEKDEDGYSFAFNQDKVDTSDEEQWSQELRLTSPSDGRALEWLGGVYYLHQQLYRSEKHGFGGPPGSLIAFLVGGADGLANGARQFTEQKQHSDVDSYAIYAEGYWHVNEWLGIRGGARYTHDHKTGRTIHTEPSRFFGDPLDVNWSHSWDKVTPRVVVELTPTDDLLFYASATSGFKSGGFTFSAPTPEEALTPLKPEDAWSYELGAKTMWFDNRLRLNVAAFYMDTKDLQVRSLQGAVLFQSNAGKTRNQGIEVESAANLFGQLYLGVNYNYIDAEYDEFPGCTASGTDCSGNKVPFTPDQTLGVFLTDTWTLGNGGTLHARGEYNYAASYHFNPTNDEPDELVDETERNDVFNAFVTYTSPGDDWEVGLWGRNIANEKSVTFAPNYFFFMLDFDEFLSGLDQAWRVSYTEPRSYGATLTYRLH